MTQVALSGGFYTAALATLPTGVASASVLDTTAEKYAMMGYLYIDGRPAGAKTLSTGTISWRTGAVTWANGSTTMDVGIQGVATGSGPICQPDGTFTVKKTLTGGAGVTANAWNTTTLNSGSASLTHGDLIAVVWDMTNRAGADSVAITNAQRLESNANGSFPVDNHYTGAAWETTATNGAGNRFPIVAIVFDDATLGWIDCAPPFSSLATETFTDASNPDERGMMFTCPFDCKADAFWMLGGAADANADWTYKLYSDPTGTPTLVTSKTQIGENFGVGASVGYCTATLATPVTLTRGTVYGVTLRATGSTNSKLNAITLGAAAHQAAYTFGTTLAKISRQNDTGAFTAESPALTNYSIGLRISSIDDGTGSGTTTSGVIGS